MRDSCGRGLELNVSVWDNGLDRGDCGRAFCGRATTHVDCCVFADQGGIVS